jgi:hypothetical protein
VPTSRHHACSTPAAGAARRLEPAREEPVEQREAGVPVRRRGEPLGQLGAGAPEHRLDRRHAVGELVHRDAEQHVRADGREPQLDPVLLAVGLDDRVPGVRRGDERAHRRGHAHLRSEADDHVHLARGHLEAGERRARPLVVAEVAEDVRPQSRRRGPVDHLPPRDWRVVALDRHGRRGHRPVSVVRASAHPREPSGRCAACRDAGLVEAAQAGGPGLGARMMTVGGAAADLGDGRGEHGVFLRRVVGGPLAG